MENINTIVIKKISPAETLKSVSRKKKNPTLAKKKSHKSVTNSLSF